MKKFQKGFLLGSIIGSIITLLATGHLIMTMYTSDAQAVSVIILLGLFSFTQVSTLYSAMTSEKNKLTNSFNSGVIAGIGFAEAIITFVLYGFRL
jgi:uncharacterized membrane protein